MARPFNSCNYQLLDLEHPVRAPPWAGTSADEASPEETAAEGVCTPSSSRGGFSTGTGGWCKGYSTSKSHRNIWITFKIRRKKWIQPSLDYISLYTNAVMKIQILTYMYAFFFFYFFLWRKRSMNGTLPRARESHCAALFSPGLQRSGWHSTASPTVHEHGICLWHKIILFYAIKKSLHFPIPQFC